ncbi:MAG TPA: helix-turn-helix domain-containing protein [Xanthobacteraceae bacterium]|jgi:AraC-like DNA-binding protein
MVAPRDVKRALDFIEANVDHDVSVSSIIAASGVPGRTLFMHFRNCGLGSPMRYLRNVRFGKAREALLRAQPGEGVLEVAVNLDFSHMGRFAAEYRRRFGESPSETLRRRRLVGCRAQGSGTAAPAMTQVFLTSGRHRGSALQPQQNASGTPAELFSSCCARRRDRLGWRFGCDRAAGVG